MAGHLDRIGLGRKFDQSAVEIEEDRRPFLRQQVGEGRRGWERMLACHHIGNNGWHACVKRWLLQITCGGGEDKIALFDPPTFQPREEIHPQHIGAAQIGRNHCIKTFRANITE